MSESNRAATQDQITSFCGIFLFVLFQFFEEEEEKSAKNVTF